MLVHSLGLSTDLELLARRGKGRIVDRGDYLAVTTPEDPGYYFGNLLVLRAPPRAGEVATWVQRFADEIGRDPAIEHVTLRWDGIHGDVGPRAELEAAGFTLDTDLVMVASSVVPARCDVTLRPLAPDELAATADLAFAISDRHDDAYRRFVHRRAAWKRELVTGGEATWWGAFDGASLVGSLGLVPLGTRARYQDVQVAASHRRRGIASALLAASADAAGVDTLVIVALPGSAAARVYERAGFRAVERTASACRVPG